MVVGIGSAADCLSGRRRIAAITSSVVSCEKCWKDAPGWTWLNAAGGASLVFRRSSCREQRTKSQRGGDGKREWIAGKSRCRISLFVQGPPSSLKHAADEAGLPPVWKASPPMVTFYYTWRFYYYIAYDRAQDARLFTGLNNSEMRYLGTKKIYACSWQGTGTHLVCLYATAKSSKNLHTFYSCITVYTAFLLFQDFYRHFEECVRNIKSYTKTKLRGI